MPPIDHPCPPGTYCGLCAFNVRQGGAANHPSNLIRPSPRATSPPPISPTGGGCCTYWCTAAGPKLGTYDATAKTVTPPPGATSGPYTSLKEAGEKCKIILDCVAICDGNRVFEVASVVRLTFANKTGFATCMPNEYPLTYVASDVGHPHLALGTQLGTVHWVPEVYDLASWGFPGTKFGILCDGLVMFSFAGQAMGNCFLQFGACSFNTVQRAIWMDDADIAANQTAFPGLTCDHINTFVNLCHENFATLPAVLGPIKMRWTMAYPGNHQTTDGTFDLYVHLDGGA